MAALPLAPMTRATLQLAGANLLLGTLGVFVVESGQDTVTVVFWRCVFGALVLAPWVGLAGWRAVCRAPAGMLALAVLAGILMVGNWLLFTAALARVGIAVATIVFHVQPFLVVLLGAALLGERPTPVRLAWVALGFGGLLAAIGPEALTAAGAGSDYLAGIACALGGALMYALVTLVAKRVSGVPAPSLALLHCLVGVPLLAGLGPAWPGAFGAVEFGWLAATGLVHTGLVYALVYAAVPALPTPVIAALTFLYPASAVVVDAMVYGRLIGPGQAAGLALIVLAGIGATLAGGPGSRQPAAVTTTRTGVGL